MVYYIVAANVLYRNGCFETQIFAFQLETNLAASGIFDIVQIA